MSLQSMLAAHDESALIALSSKGLVRRASRDASKGDCEISLKDDSAIIKTDGQTVNLTDKGPRAASCTCPATGLCRHILTAVIVLREENTSNEVEQPSEPVIQSVDKMEIKTLKTKTTEGLEKKKSSKSFPKQQATAREEIEKISETALKKYAGADLNAAISLAASVETPDITEKGLNLHISIPDSPASVTFIAGQGLKGAVYKGPTTKARLITAASAILVRRLSGLELQDIGAEPEIDPAKLHQEIDAISKTIQEAVRAVLTGVPAIAADQLFDKAIAARVQTMPRLTAQLRALAKQAMLAMSRHIDFDPTQFLEQAADCYALCEAIKKAPTDNRLTGSLKRNYQEHSPLNLWMLGARTWRSTAGARGLTSYGYCVSSRQWYETTTARAAGMDMSFSPHQAYEGALWKAGTLRSMMGRKLTLPSPKVAEDNQISQTITAPGTLTNAKLTLDVLEASGALHAHWRDLREDIAQRTGTGLRRIAFPISTLVKPDKHLDIAFDEMEQRYKWGIVDKHNEVIYLSFPSSAQDIVKKLQSMKKKVVSILIAARFEGFEIIYEPVSILLNYKNQLTVLNIQLDNIEYKRLIGRVKPKFSDFFPQFSSPIEVSYSTGLSLMDSTLDTLLDVSVSPARKDRLPAIIKKCEQAGFISISKALQPIERHLSQSTILKAVFLINQTRFLMSLNTQS